MIGNISSYASRFNVSSYAASRTHDTGYAVSSQKAAQPQTPVQPVRAVDKTAPETQTPKSFGLSIREGADPAEMAVRMRIKYAEDPAQLKLSGDLNGETAASQWEQEQSEKLKELGLPGQQQDEAAMSPWEQERAQKLKELGLPGQQEEEEEKLKLPGASEDEDVEKTPEEEEDEE